MRLYQCIQECFRHSLMFLRVFWSLKPDLRACFRSKRAVRTIQRYYRGHRGRAQAKSERYRQDEEAWIKAWFACRATKPRAPRSFDTIEGRRNSVSGGQTT